MRLIWTRPALADVIAIYESYRDIDGDLARRMTDAIETAPLALLVSPRLGSRVDRSVLRKWRVRRTPFLLFYRPSSDAITIERVRHDRSDWLSLLA